MNGEKKEAEEVREILEVVGDKLPQLLNDLSDSLPKLLSALRDSVYSEEAARNMAKSIAVFYQELKESELPDEMALKMTKDYAENLDFTKYFKGGHKELKFKLEKDEDEC
ncbi:MAG: hypothetical protein ACE5K0_10020 [Candidatus Methanofastidiosia archaeon]